MPPRKSKRPSKEDIKAKADKAEGKASTAREDYDPLNPPEPAEELEEMPGGVQLPRKRHPGGRPTKYKPEYARIAEAMFRKGATVNELAGLFGVTNSTIWLWQQTHEEFSNAFSNIGAQYDERIERALAERALGYSFDAVKYFHYQGAVVSQPYREHVPPDIAAIKMWLSARQPEKWRVKDEVEVSTPAEAFIEMWRAVSGKANSDKKE